MFGAGIAQLNTQDPTQVKVVSGTSLSAPFMASFFTLVNEKLFRDGYKTIGYANPMLYWMGENCTDAINDVTIGNNQPNKGDGDNCLNGFPAAPGWDAVTGLGTIQFEPFVKCAKRHQDEVRSKGLELLPGGSYRPVPYKNSTFPLASGPQSTHAVSALSSSISISALALLCVTVGVFDA